MARSFAKYMVIISLLFFFSHASLAESPEPTRFATSPLKDIGSLQSPDCRFLPSPINGSIASRNWLPDTLTNSTCPFECCFVSDSDSKILLPPLPLQDSNAIGVLVWSTRQIREAVHRTLPIAVRLAQSTVRLVTTAADYSRFAHETDTDCPSTEAMDAYWQYYSDCDRWGVVFSCFEPHSRDSTTAIDSICLKKEGRSWILVNLDKLGPLVSLIRPVSESVSKVSSPFFSAWQNVEYWIIESPYVDMFSTPSTESVVDEENLYQLR